MLRLALAILVSLGVAGQARAAKKLAFVVGIDKYDNLDRPLQRAVNDARAVGKAFRGLGFDVMLGENLARADFDAKWHAFLEKIAEGDIVAVFFAGHGIEVEGMNYLLPRDVPYFQQARQGLARRQSFSITDLVLDLGKRRPQMTLMILDACRENPFVSQEYRSVGISKGGLLPKEQPGTFIMYSAAAGERALDRLRNNDPDTLNSVYTRALLPLLTKPGLTLPQLALQVRRDVMTLAATQGDVQRPAYYDNIDSDFCLAGCAVEARAPAAPNPASEAEWTWALIKHTTDQAVLENFIKRFGDTEFAAKARARLEELRKLAAAPPSPATKPAPPPPATKPPDEPKSPAPTPASSTTPQPEPKRPPAAAPAAPGGSCDGVWVATGAANEHRCLKPKDTFRDCRECPEMVVIPAGEFMMGTPAPTIGDEYRNRLGKDAYGNEVPDHKVTIARPFAVGKFEVTFAEWDACAKDLCLHKEDQGWGRDKFPVINVSWDDAVHFYLAWLNRKTGKTYRLPTEAEWEYAARAGSAMPYAFGHGYEITKQQAQFSEGSLGSAGKTVKVGSFKPNAFGLHDMHGNVWEWVADCYKGDYRDAPSDGRAVASSGICEPVLRGGSWHTLPRDLRSARRAWASSGSRSDSFGFRVARTLD